MLPTDLILCLASLLCWNCCQGQEAAELEAGSCSGTNQHHFDGSSVVQLEELLTNPELMLKFQANQGKQVIFIETSGASFLDKRQACAVESAARSGRIHLLLS